MRLLAFADKPQFGGESGIRTLGPFRDTAFRVGVAIQTSAENKRTSTTMQELKSPCKIKAFSLLKGGILKKPCVTRSSNIFRFWGEKSALGRRWGELGEKITVLNADDTYLRAE